jgi:hypothetical protein
MAVDPLHVLQAHVEYHAGRGRCPTQSHRAVGEDATLGDDPYPRNAGDILEAIEVESAQDMLTWKVCRSKPIDPLRHFVEGSVVLLLELGRLLG